MRKNLRELFDNYLDETVNLNTNISISSDRVLELTKNKITEEQIMNTSTGKTKRKWSVSLVAAAIIAAISLTAFAAYYFLTPKDVATHLERYELADLFSKDDTTFNIPAQTSGDYNIELLGMTSGKNLDKVPDADVDKELTYIVGAITKADGSAVTDYSNLMITPLVEGYKPWQINIFTIGNGGKHTFIYEGVEYFLIECGSIEIFADKQVYIAVYEGGAPSSDLFNISENGAISFNESYKGEKALFEIPLDKSKANPDAVNALLEKHGFEEKDVIYTTSILTESDNQESEYGVPEKEVEITLEEVKDGTEFEYVIE